MLIHLPARWVNGWDAVQLHQTKPVQLAMVAKLGVPIPRTIITNAPQPLLQIRKAQPARHFQAGAGRRAHAAAHRRSAHRREPGEPQDCAGLDPGGNPRHQRARLRDRRARARLRDSDRRGRFPRAIDAHSASRRTAFARAGTSPAARSRRTLGLVWTGIDFRLTPDGRYVFLEANPSPMFIGFEERSGLPLTQALADLLLQSQSLTCIRARR